MIGILIVAHEPVASSFAAALGHVLGNVPAQLTWLDVANDARPDEWLARAGQQAAQLDSGAGVLIFTDVCGATPCNIANQLIQPGKVHVISGLNMPMLLRAINYRNLPLAELTEKALAGGKNGVMQMERGDVAGKN
jgi:mannose PTS system EIIA component